MRILSYQNSQYAGMRNQNVSFCSGMNVILGNNETGKSTMLTGIYDTLMMHSNLNLKQDTEFINQRFPVGGGNCIDGTVLLEDAGQKITIKKIWDKNKKDSYAELDSGNKYSGEAAEEQIKKLLNFGEAIYNNIIFGRQNNENAVLDWFYSFLSASSNAKIEDTSIIDTREKITEVLSAAGNVPEDLYRTKIEEKLRTLSLHWDFSKNSPENGRGIENPWEREVGEILKSFYHLKKQEKDFKEHQTLIESLRESIKKLNEKLEQKKNLETESEKLRQVYPDVVQKDSLLKLQVEQTDNITRFQNTITDWNAKTESKAKLDVFMTQAREKKKRDRFQELSDKLEELNDLSSELRECENTVKNFKNITQDVSDYENLRQKILELEGMLGSAKLHANITMLSEQSIQMITADGLIPEIKGQYVSNINGFAKIVIPGIAEIVISPQQLNVPALQNELEIEKCKAETILQKYQVESYEHLLQKHKMITGTNTDIDRLKKKIKDILKESTKDQLIKEKENFQMDEGMDIPENLGPLIASELDIAIGFDNMDICIPVIQSKIQDTRSKIQEYEQKYDSIDELNNKITKEKQLLKDTEDELKKFCPFESIMTKKDYDEKMRKIKDTLGNNDNNSGLLKEINDLNQKIGAHRKAAEDIDLETEEREIQESEEILNQQKKLYKQYDKIKEDFKRLKAQQGNNKFDAFYTLFNTYLSAITSSQVQAGNEKLRTNSAELYYQNLQKTKGSKKADDLKALLSQGTKQSILLAFRLALLKYYFPEESGVIILDDILLDMDSNRRKCAVKLLQDFSKNNQVIFTTCDPGIADMLGGNRITL